MKRQIQTKGRFDPPPVVKADIERAALGVELASTDLLQAGGELCKRLPGLRSRLYTISLELTAMGAELRRLALLGR